MNNNKVESKTITNSKEYIEDLIKNKEEKQRENRKAIKQYTFTLKEKENIILECEKEGNITSVTKKYNI